MRMFPGVLVDKVLFGRSIDEYCLFSKRLDGHYARIW